MLSRLVLAFVLAVPPFLPFLARSLDAEQTFTISIQMASSSPGLLEIYPDVGGGYSPNSVMRAATQPSVDAREYRLPITSGSYHSLRIDPGFAPGSYRIESIAIFDPGGREYAAIALEDLQAAYHLTVVERAADHVTFDCPPGAFDPQVIYAPAQPLRLLPAAKTLMALTLSFLGLVAVAYLATWLIGKGLRPFTPICRRALQTTLRGAQAHPQVTLLVVALIATSMAMYPVLFLGRSLVSPNNGGVAMLYPMPPFMPSSSDVDIEDVRGNDVGATMWAFVPYSKIQRLALANWEWPLWNRYAGPGLPMWGQGQTFLMDPLHWLTLLGPDPAPGWDLKFAAHRATFAWGIGAASLVATGSLAPAAVAAGAAPFVGFYVFRLNHPVAFVVTYAPWILVGWFLLAKATSSRHRAAAGLLIAAASALVLLSSPPKEGTMTLLVCEGIGILALVTTQGLTGRMVRSLAVVGVAAGSTVLLTAPHWVVFLDTLRSSYTHYDNAAAYFASIGFLRAMALGPLTGAQPLPALHTAALAFVVAAACAPRRLVEQRAILACAVGGAAAISIAMGIIPEKWIVAIPLLRNVHSFHMTLLTASIVPLSVFSAAGVANVLEASRLRVAAITVGIVAAAYWIAGGIAGLGALGRFHGWLALGALFGASLIPVTMLAVRRSGSAAVLPWLAVAALLLLLLAPGGQHLETRVAPLNTVLVQPRPRYPLATPSPTIEAIHSRSQEPSRVVGMGLALIPGSQALYGVEGISGPDALILRSQTDLLLAPGDLPRDGWRFSFLPNRLAHDAALLDLLNVRYVLELFTDAPALGRTLPTTAPDLISAVERPTAWPRAFFTDRVTTYTDAPGLLQLVAEAGRPIAAIQEEDDVAASLVPNVSNGIGLVVRADRYQLATNSTQFHIRAPHAGVAVLSESYMPDDFIATLNGHPVPYFRVNHAFKGVAIPGAGEWEVRFEYRPRHWTLALTAAAAGALVLAAMAIVAVRRPGRG